jgi:acyl-coenzyme A synthetase/AMP-(fatty) acid ligase
MITASIFDWAEQTPDKTALVFNGQAWRYRDFAGAIAVMRGYFHRRGLTGAGVAALAFQNLRDLWVVSLALRSLGLTTLAAQAPESLRRLDLPDLRCVLASPSEPAPGLEAICAELGLPLLAVAPDGGPALGPDQAAPAAPGGHVLQTSGTTGDYKMVLFDPAFEDAFMAHRRAVNGVGHDSVLNLFEFGLWTGVGYKCPVAAWGVGATVVIHQSKDYPRALLRPGLTHTTVVPSLLAALLAAPPDAYPRSETLRMAIAAGAASQAQVDEARARITPHLFGRVGSTEVGTFGYTRLDTAEDRRWHRIAPGRQVQVVDEQDRPVAVGAVGRVRVDTRDCPAGYLHDPETTRAFFRDGFFYPGDLAAFRIDGRLTLHGRATDVINLAGHKLAPAPIEDRLREALGVAGVCLVSMPDEAGDEQVHVVLETAGPVDPARLVAALSAELGGIAQAMVHQVQGLPRNGMGKVMRQAVRSRLAAD